MTSPSEIDNLQARIAYLEDNRRYIQNALETVLSIGEFQTTEQDRTSNVNNVLQQAGRKICRIIPFSNWAFFLVDEETFLFDLISCEPTRDRDTIEEEVERMVDQGLFAWAVREKRGVFVPAQEGSGQFLLHVIASDNRIRGMFIGGLPKRKQSIADTALVLLSIILMRVANALEDLDFRRFLENQKEILEEQVEQRTKELTLSEAQLKASMEQARQLAKEAKNASEAKSDFLAKMSHELRTPLNGIIGMTEVALATELDDQQQQILEIVDRESNALLKIINDILDFSKVEAGKLELEEIDFNLRTIMDEVGDTLALYAAKKGLEMSTFLPPRMPTRLIGDPLRLKQILLNLTGNAVKFTDQGEIRIIAQLIGESDLDATIQLIVQDTGIGIPKEKHDAIFQGFSQADESTTRKYGGTGLGITISSQLVHLMGGDLSVDSELGRGSTFSFTLKFAKQFSEKHMPRGPSDAPCLNTLVVGGPSFGRKVLIQYLENLGCDVGIADHGRAAWDQCMGPSGQAPRYDIVFTNVRMPNMTGVELAAKIKTLPPDRQMPVVAVTGIQDLIQNQDAASTDFDFLLARPLKSEALGTLLSDIRNGDGTCRNGQPSAAADNGNDSIEIPDRKASRILLVDDYPTNQKVAHMHLSAAGYGVDIAEDGAQAVEAFKSSVYDLILMDIQMPVMDGYEAARRIRQWESAQQAAGSPRPIPIIAMTAHAFKEDEQRCRDAGMDDFISKPIRRKALISAVDRWTQPLDGKSASNESAPPPVPGQPESHPPPIDLATAEEEFGSREMVMEVVTQLLRNIDGQIAVMSRALVEKDPQLLQRESHSIKGGAWTVEARPLGDVAEKIEHLSRKEDLIQVAPAMKTLGLELERLKAYISTLKEGPINENTGH